MLMSNRISNKRLGRWAMLNNTVAMGESDLVAGRERHGRWARATWSLGDSDLVAATRADARTDFMHSWAEMSSTPLTTYTDNVWRTIPVTNSHPSHTNPMLSTDSHRIARYLCVARAHGRPDASPRSDPGHLLGWPWLLKKAASLAVTMLYADIHDSSHRLTIQATR